MLNGSVSCRRDLHFVEDGAPLGPAGCLRSCAPRFQTQTVFVTHGAIWLEEDPQWMVEQHRTHGNAVTVFCNDDTHRALMFGRTALRPCGVYCMDHAALGHLQDHRFQDIKEQMIPKVRDSGQRVGVVRVRSPVFEVRDWPAYMRALSRSCANGLAERLGFEEVSAGVWCGRNVTIAPGAQLNGPIVLGNGCRIGRGVSLIGPVMLGDLCTVEDETVLLRVVAPSATRFAAGSVHLDRLISYDPEKGFGLGRCEGKAGQDRVGGTKASRGAFARLE